MLDVSEGQNLVSNKGVESTRGTDDDVGILLLVFQKLDVLGHRCTTVEDGGLDVWKVLAEAGVFVLDLICQFASVAHHKD